MDAAALRREFAVLEHTAYMNAGTDGPVARAAVAAAHDAVTAQSERGRHAEHFQASSALSTELRGAYAGLLGCGADDVALTTSTTDGIGRVLAGLDLGPSDEIVTSDCEHPGVVGPLIVARRRGARIVTAPFASLAEAVGDATTLVVCSHVSWLTGDLVDARLADVDVPVVLDGAQGIGAVPVDVSALGCAAYAGSGQKWLCGADGTGALYVTPALRERVRPVTLGYTSLADASQGLDGAPHPSARRFDTPSLGRESLAFSAAAHRVLAGFGWEAVHARARALAHDLAGRLTASGRSVVSRGDGPLVTWHDVDPAATAARLAAAGVVIRDLPGTPYLRASTGAWNDESDLDRLLAELDV
jgi:L-cysteine/cystine lyase